MLILVFTGYVKKESLNVEFELTNLCFKRDISQIHFEHLVDN